MVRRECHKIRTLGFCLPYCFGGRDAAMLRFLIFGKDNSVSGFSVSDDRHRNIAAFRMIYHLYRSEIAILIDVKYDSVHGAMVAQKEHIFEYRTLNSGI